jgi:hypothetical protein
MPAAALAVATVLLLAQDPRPRAECREWHECRQLALDAAAREDYEAFHDLAWRAVQTGPKNESDLMYLLARAQSLSGRPGDALVMLGRLVDAGVPVDVSTDDFRYVRALAAWPALRDRVEGRPVPPASTPAPSRPAASAPGAALAPAPTAGLAAAPSADADDAAHFMTPGATPVALAYDGVSRRFVVADRATRKLSVVDEFTQHVATLAGAPAAFADISAIEIDPREGHLWVVSSEQGGQPPATLHKLQLISGRVLATFPLPAAFGSARFTDVAVTQTGTVLALDGERGRLFRLRGTALELATTLEVPKPTSLAPAENGVVYVAHDSGIVRIDSAGNAASLNSSGDRRLDGLGHIRWHRGSLIGTQGQGDALKLVRVVLDRAGRSVRSIDLLDPSSSAADATAVTITGDTLYYLAPASAGQATLRRVRLK